MRKFIDAVKNILIIVLGVSMLVLWINYINLRFDRTDSEGGTPLESDFWVFTDTAGSHPKATVGERFFSPVSVSIMLSGEGYTSAFNTELTDTLYTNYSPLLQEVFSSSYVCKRSNAQAWEKALELQDSVLIEYADSLPYTTIALFLQKNSDFCQGELCYVEKILLFSDSSNSLCALSLDSENNVYSYTLPKDSSPSFVYDFNSNNLAAYTVNEGFIPFEFNKKDASTKTFENLASEYKLLLSAPSLPSVVTSNPLQATFDAVYGEQGADYFELISEPLLSRLLSAFEINPNIVGYYSDTNSGLIFVGQDMRFVISPSGAVSYTLIDKDSLSITTASLLDTADSNFTANELLIAATAFLDKLPAELLGGEARLILERIAYFPESAEMEFTFGYYYELTNVTCQPIVLTFNQKGLIKAKLTPVSISRYSEKAENNENYLDTEIVPSIVVQMTDRTASTLEPVYTYKGYGDIITPLWATGGKK